MKFTEQSASYMHVKYIFEQTRIHESLIKWLLARAIWIASIGKRRKIRSSAIRFLRKN